MNTQISLGDNEVKNKYRSLGLYTEAYLDRRTLRGITIYPDVEA